MSNIEEPKGLQDAFAEIEAVMNKHNFNGMVLLCQDHPVHKSNFQYARSMTILHNDTKIFQQHPSGDMNLFALLEPEKINADPDGGLERYRSSVRLLQAIIKAGHNSERNLKNILSKIGISYETADIIDPVKVKK